MTGSAHWLWFALSLLVVAVLAAALWSSRRRARELEERAICLTCPTRDEPAVCRAVRHRASGIWTGVRSCSLFDPPEAVSCNKVCLDIIEHLPAARA